MRQQLKEGVGSTIQGAGSLPGENMEDKGVSVPKAPPTLSEPVGPLLLPLRLL